MNESFPELEAFEREQKARHLKLVRLLIATGLVFFGFAFGILVLGPKTTGGFVAVGTFFIMGVICTGRGLLSWFTDIDTRDRHEFDEIGKHND